MRIGLVFESPHRFDGRAAQVTRAIAGHHYCGINRGDNIHAGIAPLNLKHHVAGYFLRSNKLHLIYRSHGFKFTSRKKAVLAGIDSNHLELAEFLEFLTRHPQLKLAVEALRSRCVDYYRYVVEMVL